MNCRIAIGDFCCGLNFSDSDIQGAAARYYNRYVCGRTPDITIDVEIVHKQALELPESILDLKTVSGSSFNFCDGLIEGEWDIEKSVVRVYVPRQLLRERIRLFEQFLMEVYYTWLMLAQVQLQSFGCLVHACGAVRHGFGYIFTGPSGSGKSTVANMVRCGHVLNDEIVLVRFNRKHFEVLSTPFTGSYREKQSMSSPLKSVFFLVHSKQNRVRAINSIDAALEFIKQVIVCRPLVSTDFAEMRRNISDLALQLVSQVGFYRLFFTKDERVWVSVDSLFDTSKYTQIEEAL